MPGVVIVGAQWGDEGKGKVVDLLAERAEAIIRFTKGAQLLLAADPAARSAYEARITGSAAPAEQERTAA